MGGCAALYASRFYDQSHVSHQTGTAPEVNRPRGVNRYTRFRMGRVRFAEQFG